MHSRRTGSPPPSRTTARRWVSISVRRRHTLHREHTPAERGQRQAPAGEAIQRRDGPCRDDVRWFHVKHVRSGGDLFRPGADDLDPGIEAKIKRHGLQEDGTPSQRLDQHHTDGRASDRQDDTRQTSTRSDIYHIIVLTDQRCHRDAVQDVPIPDARRLAWTDQAAYDAFGGKQFGVRLGAIQTCPEQPLRHGAQFVGQRGNRFRHPQTLPIPRSDARTDRSGRRDEA